MIKDRVETLLCWQKSAENGAARLEVSRGRPLTIYMDAIIEDMKTGGTMVGRGGEVTEKPRRSRMYSLELFKLTDFIESMGQESPKYSVMGCLFHLLQLKSTQASNVHQRLAVQVKVQQQ